MRQFDPYTPTIDKAIVAAVLIMLQGVCVCVWGGEVVLSACKWVDKGFAQ